LHESGLAIPPLPLSFCKKNLKFFFEKIIRLARVHSSNQKKIAWQVRESRVSLIFTHTSSLDIALDIPGDWQEEGGGFVVVFENVTFFSPNLGKKKHTHTKPWCSGVS
jgi:hypothetical protein